MTTFREEACNTFRLHPGSTDVQIEYGAREYLSDMGLADKLVQESGRRALAKWLELDPQSDDEQILAAVHARLSGVAGLDQYAASVKMLALTEQRAAEKKIDVFAAACEIAAENLELAELALPTPVRPSSMSHNRNEPGADARNPAPTRPATALGTAEQKIREHLALTGQTDRAEAIVQLLNGGLPIEVKAALCQLLANENPRLALHELAEQRRREKDIEHRVALREIVAENMDLAERAAAS